MNCSPVQAATETTGASRSISRWYSGDAPGPRTMTTDEKIEHSLELDAVVVTVVIALVQHDFDAR